MSVNCSPLMKLRIGAMFALMAVCVASFTSRMWLFFNYMSVRPRNPMPVHGFVRQMSNHGAFYYITDVESAGLDLLMDTFIVAFVCMLIAAPLRLRSGPQGALRWTMYGDGTFGMESECLYDFRNKVIFVLAILLMYSVIYFFGNELTQLSMSWGIVM